KASGMSGPQRLRVSVLGAGSWGTALAVLASAQTDTLLWARDPELADAIGQAHTNRRYLPDIALPQALRATADFQQAVDHACQGPDGQGLIILGVPVVGLDSLCTRLAKALPAAGLQRLSVVW